MKKIIISVFFLLFFSSASFADVISGKVRQDDKLYARNQVVDSKDGSPVDNAKVSIPKNGFETYTGQDGRFELNTKIDSTTVLSVEKEGFRPYSLTIDKNSLNQPLKLGIERSKSGDIQLEASLFHLGDNVFADTSANSSDFKIKSIGTFFTKKFNMAPISPSEEALIVIGTVIGLDTKLAKEMGQNRIASVFSSPAEIFFNGQKIGELNINGDNQEILIPRNLIRPTNEVTVRTGKNLFQHAYVDYDDIELANLRIETREKQTFAGGW
ncbi:MAG: carboxypeptidase-like regulatory domain-containing protein [Candidatus Gastranaerophilales bacterium]|nr:carboxypeptidase-like regulatory domain-containing protein [Candidatus Gastranaerophilales bacterium]